ncbi:hypothetical protein [Corallococcus macrosporus]|nr:hypothetical protein [Corallococcus macrosporus]
MRAESYAARLTHASQACTYVGWPNAMSAITRAKELLGKASP